MKIAVYGLSTETQKAISVLEKEYIIVGLLDGFKTDGEIYGYPIIPIDKAVSDGVEKVVVVARPGSCKAITKRIGAICRKYKIELFDIRGKDLLQDGRIVYDFKMIKGYRYADLINLIDESDVISFDLFDTLVVRNTLLSSDVPEIVAEKLKEEASGQYYDFTEKRIAAEKKLSQEGVTPRLKDIYIKAGIAESQAEKFADYEYETDLKLLSPRCEVIKLLEVARSREKEIYITSDTFYSYKQIDSILSANGITGFDGLLLSCECGTSKTGELYKVLKEKTNTENILHIGDDIVADVEKAKMNGLKTFQIYSASELLDMVGGLGLDKYTNYLSDRIRIGMFASIIFNSPFQFEDENRRLHINTSFDLGYLICAPMIMDFVLWLKSQTENDRYSDILFCARDGYLIKQIYELMKPVKESKYFLTSRISSIRAGVSTESDIEYVDEMKFSGTIEDNLKCRFGLNAAAIPANDIDISKQGLLQYSKSILEAAKIKKENNKRYVESIGLGTGDIAFFDFVSKGTSQMYAQRLITNHISGLYFLQLEPDYMKKKNLDIIPFYTEEERADSAIFDNYYILETILTSPDPSIDEFDGEGMPLYANETRSEKDIDCFMRVQNGILDYTERYLSICPFSKQFINKKLDEVFLRLIHNVEIKDIDFLNLVVEDPFFSRMTDVNDVL